MNTIIQMDLNDLRQILKETQEQALAESQSRMYDKFYNVYLTYKEVCKLHSTCHRTLNDMVSAGIITPIEGKFQASDVLKWDFAELKKKLRYIYKTA